MKYDHISLMDSLSRRVFLAGSLSPLALATAQQGPPREERVENLTPGETPTIALNHLGFVPDARKLLVVRIVKEPAPTEFTLRDIGSPPEPFRIVKPLKKVESDFGPCAVGDFSDVTREAMYQITVGQERSVPFFIQGDVWRRTLPKAVGYIRAQRCGCEVPNVHPVCHLDDTRRRDTGEHVDVTGGWHDAGDLRKWMSATMLSGFALLTLARNLGESCDRAGSGLALLLDEFRWGNRYFLKMQDRDGRVWADTAGGVNGDNSDNHWTDNKIGTADDRYINTAKNPTIQAMFTGMQAMAAQAFRSTDAEYAAQLLAASQRCWEANKRGSRSAELAWWARAAAELYRATGNDRWQTEAVALGRRLLELQETRFVGGQKLVRGFWRTGPNQSEPYTDAVHASLPPLVLLELAETFDEHPDAKRWLDAVRLHLSEYVAPMCARSAYGILPFGIFIGSPTPESYRPLAGELTYRYFMPVRKQYWWVGTTSHLLSYAYLLARAARVLKDNAWRDLAYRQMEWVMGANPFGACLMTGEGIRNPYPHSRFVGLIIGGIMNGIGGNVRDEPVLDTENGYDWRTTEYWSPHNAYYISAVSALG